MNKINFSKLGVEFGSIILLASFILFSPNISSAALVDFKVVPNTANDGTSIVEARIDPESKALNVIEGVVNFEGDVEGLSVDIETDGSILTLWPTSPQYIEEDKSIRFTGGVPMGFEKEGLLFRMKLSSSASSTIKIAWAGGMAYLNDGLGTNEYVSSRSLTLNMDQTSIREESGLAKYVIFILILIVILIFAYRYANKKILKN